MQTSYSAFSARVTRGGIEALVLCLAIIIPLSVQAGFFSETTPAPYASAAIQNVISNSAIELPFLSASKNPDPLGARGGGEVLVYEGALVSTGPVGEDVIASTRRTTGEINVYVVRPGDSLSQIAEMFGVTSNTIRWANDLTSSQAIQPGQTLIILPVPGVRHVVKDGDTIASIVKKYDADTAEVLTYNQLLEDDELSIGATLIIPGGAIATPAPAVARSSGGSSAGASSLAHPVPGAIKTQGVHGYNAVDFAAGSGTAIRAAAAGEVIVSKSSGWNGGYGQYIVIRHNDGVQTLYAHLSRNDVGVGAYVGQGQVIGGMGNTGRSTGNHLHFEVRGTRNPF